MNTITEKALIGRINRKLALKGEAMRKSRNPSGDLGTFYIVDNAVNGIVDRGIDDLEQWARDEMPRGHPSA